MSILEVENLSITFKNIETNIRVLNDVTFQLNEGEVLGIVGESGSGKSVTAFTIMGFIEENGGCIDKGGVFFRGKNLLKESEKNMCKIRGNHISLIFQESMNALSPLIKIEKQLDEVLKIHKNEYLRKTSRKKRILEVLEELGLSDAKSILKKYPYELSGGMCQRVVIALSLLCSPEIIIADEPTTALDVTTQAEILVLLKDAVKTRKNSMIFITHDLSVVSEVCDRVLVMYCGYIVESCKVESFFEIALHPYSRGLLKSMPENFDGKFHVIKGNITQMSEKITGCIFHNRCELADELCNEKMPPPRKMSKTHTVSCWKVGDDYINS